MALKARRLAMGGMSTDGRGILADGNLRVKDVKVLCDARPVYNVLRGLQSSSQEKDLSLAMLSVALRSKMLSIMEFAGMICRSQHFRISAEVDRVVQSGSDWIESLERPSLRDCTT